METEKVTEVVPAEEELVAALLVPARDQTEEAAVAAPAAEQRTEVAEDSARPDSERVLLLLEKVGACFTEDNLERMDNNSGSRPLKYDGCCRRWETNGLR